MLLSKKVTQYGKRAGLYTHCFVSSIDVYNHSMDLTSVTWIATEPSWRHLTHAFLAHIGKFGLARVQVRLALHIFNTNNSASLILGCSFTLEILHLWNLLCYFELVSWCIHKFQKKLRHWEYIQMRYVSLHITSFIHYLVVTIVIGHNAVRY